MKIDKNKNLKNLNTFGVTSFAKEFIELSNYNDLKEILDTYDSKDIVILGGGSNILFTSNVDKLVLKIEVKGKEILEKNDDYIKIKVNAGENSHEFILWCIENGYGGIENLSLIPGNVGTSPIQNIGAYGVEIKDVIDEVNVFDLEDKKEKTLSNKECNFGYRESIFKQNKGKYIVLSVVFKLTKRNHKINISYGDIEKELEGKETTLRNISNAIIKIRESKIPNFKEIGNGGSFYKNPVISKEKFNELKNNFEDIRGWEQERGGVKISAGWLIEKCGLKGKKFGNCGVYEKQALILVNYGNANGSEVLDMSKEIQKQVFDKFGITITPEINIY